MSISDIAAIIDKNEYKGEIKPNIYIKAVRNSGVSDDDYFASELLYNKIKSGKPLSEIERIKACPDRKFSALVFRYVKSMKKCNRTPEQIALKIGFGSEMTCKVRVVLDAFCELGLLKDENGCYIPAQNAEKVSLGEATILKKLGYSY